MTVLGNGDLDIPGAGRIRAGFTRADRGVLAFGSVTSGVLSVSTTEDDPAGSGRDEPMTLEELRDSLRRVLGADLPLGAPLRLTRFTFQARQAPAYRAGRVLLAGDAAHLFPATGVAGNAGMLDSVNLAWKLAAAIGGRRRMACWAPTMTSATSPPRAPCCTPRPRWR